MTKVFHTPGAFGNYLAFLIDSKNNGKLLDDPFTASGSSHNREKITRSYDIVTTIPYDNFKECTNNDIGIYWPTEYFFYILHSAYGRTNNGQYGICGVKALQDNTWQWFNQHQGHGQPGNSLSMFLDGLKEIFFLGGIMICSLLKGLRALLLELVGVTSKEPKFRISI